MNNVTRRSILRSVATVPAAAIVTTMPVVALARPAENPDLLALGEIIDSLLESYRSAVQSKKEALAHFERTRPTMPKELVYSRNEDQFYLQDYAEREVDVNGKDIYPPGRSTMQRQIFSSRLLRAYIIMENVPRGTKRGKFMRRLARVARDYEISTAAALKRSGYEDKAARAERLAVKMHQLVREIREIEPLTVHGLHVYARASLAFDECACEVGGSPGCGGGWLFGSQLAKAVLRVQALQS